MEEHLSGFIAIIGPPNVGKSTLMNRLLGTKVSIVSPRPQTTRNRILGVVHGRGFQMVFLDTPGIHKTLTPLHRSMVASAQATFSEVDTILVMIEMSRPDDPDIGPILRTLKETGRPAVLAINKIDKGKKETALPVIEVYSQRYPFEAVVPISALTGDGVESLVDELVKGLRPGPPFFPPDMHTDQTEAFLFSEIIREKIFLHTKREIPYSTAVTIDHIEEREEKGLVAVAGKIHVETESQKKILIGRGGAMIKAIGRSSRKEIERILGTRVFLDLLVRVEKNWSRDPRALRRLGY
ncbi:MAG: GTPase Era [Deltaproteobacteria bacterium]|nr:GTPase Era [Deltaproteobacteria bacterium]